MYILVTKEEYRTLTSACAMSYKRKHNKLKCKRCALSPFCLKMFPPGESLSAACVIVPEGEDAFVSIDESEMENSFKNDDDL